MKKEAILKQFEYTIPASAFVLGGATPNQIIARHIPLMKVEIDFENGSFKLEGDWQFMMASNNDHEASWFTYHKERVKIEAVVYPAFPINLDSHESDGLVFLMKGNIKDGINTGCCSGLVVIDSISNGDAIAGNLWNICLYLSDYQVDSCEIVFKLPLNVLEMNANLN